MKKKILHVSYGGIFNGGVASVILSIVSTLHNEYDFGSLVFKKVGTREHIFAKYGSLHRVNCYFGGEDLKKYWEYLTRPFKLTVGTYKVCKKHHYDILHAHNGMDMVFCMLGARLAGVHRIIAHSHNTSSPQKPLILRRLYNSFMRYLINLLATDRVGCSRKACEDFFHHSAFTPIPNAIDLSEFSWKRNPHKGLSIVHVGRYDYQKNQAFVIDVVNKLKDAIPNCSLKLIGFGQDEKMLRDKVTLLHMNDIVEFCDGKKVDIHEAYANADIMVFPSNYEGFGIVLIEAQATGCYVFASDVVPEETNVGAMTMLSLHETAETWAKTIEIYWQNDKRPSFSIVSDQIKKFDVNLIANLYRKLYD